MLTIVESRNARKAPKAATSNTAVDDGCRRLVSGMGRPSSVGSPARTASVSTVAPPRPPLFAMSTPIQCG